MMPAQISAEIWPHMCERKNNTLAIQIFLELAHGTHGGVVELRDRSGLDRYL